MNKKAFFIVLFLFSIFYTVRDLHASPDKIEGTKIPPQRGSQIIARCDLSVCTLQNGVRIGRHVATGQSLDPKKQDLYVYCKDDKNRRRKDIERTYRMGWVVTTSVLGGAPIKSMGAPSNAIPKEVRCEYRFPKRDEIEVWIPGAKDNR